MGLRLSYEPEVPCHVQNQQDRRLERYDGNRFSSNVVSVVSIGRFRHLHALEILDQGVARFGSTSGQRIR